MTCREFHSYFENPLLLETTVLDTSAELSEHVGDCPECNLFIEMQKELAVNLRLASQSAPQVPASLDRAVLANYRQYVAERRVLTRSTSLRNRIRPVSVLAWAAALAAAILVAQEELLLFFPGNTATVTDRQHAAQPASPPQPPNTRTRAQVVAQKNPTREQTLPAHRKHRAPVVSAPAPDSVFPAFSSLLYCDQISCGGAMDVIRLQLPSSVLRSTQASARANLVSADVLVGSDGIARAIRIVE